VVFLSAAIHRGREFAYTKVLERDLLVITCASQRNGVVRYTSVFIFLNTVWLAFRSWYWSSGNAEGMCRNWMRRLDLALTPWPAQPSSLL